ncbi:IS1182 family transposase [Oleomonas cavernae]|uniref:IS1182 family transposase n=1 Tax=Oleomonas cavernae TaxID=2320859 RepID=A0A418W9V3_9PROT|nr:IS1182 family transposase [Oleomonas cavernae]RJF86724.1 IS1182 family transposase [Oleomonas cavernae]
MGHIEGSSRDQRELVAASLDERLDEAHVVRVIDAFVETLDLQALGFSRVAAGTLGRPAFHPGDLLKLYVYGYSNQMRSSRRLEREAVRNLEVQWLINRLMPSFKTIADFRKDHAQAIVAVTRSFVGFCRGHSLLGGALVAIDGSKIEAVASRKKVLTPKALAKQAAALDAKIAGYLAAMDAADRDDAAAEPAGSAPAVAAALAALRQRREDIQAQTKALADQGLSQLVIGEAEARLMKTAHHGHQVAYNAQTAVDGRHGLIAAFELTSDGNDLGQLLPMAEQAKAVLEVEALTVVADTGYSNGEQGKACAAAGITAAVPRPETVQTRDTTLFSRDAFRYDAAGDRWTCPAGATLTLFKTSQTEKVRHYRTEACAGCALKPQCTKAARRTIARHFYEDDRQAMHRHASDDPGLMKRRRELAEHPFGHMKWLLGYPRFLVRGLEKARSELALAVLGFNLKRAITILGVPAILDALRVEPA